MEGFLRHDLNVNRGRPDLALQDTTADPDTPVAKAAAHLLSQDLQPVFGPYLRFNNWDINTSLWTGSVLIIAHHSVTNRPFLKYTSATAGSQFSEGSLLDTYGQHNFWRFSLATPLGQQPQILSYSLDYGQGASVPPSGSYNVHLPSRDQPWHWGFHSCSGFSLSVTQAEWGGVAPLWNDLLEQHRASPIHLVVGGGDQLYNDALFKLPTTKLWLAIKDAKQRDTAPFHQEMAAQVYEYYFRNYAVHFSSDGMSTAFATIPQTMTWDDHDIFDGWGSYPDTLQNCPVFQGCYQAALRFYLLFQQHTSLQRIGETDLFGHRGYNMIKQCGPQLALVIPDARAERTKPQVIDPQSWEMLFGRMKALPPSVRHIVMVTTVPVVYPQIPGSEKILEVASGADRGNKFANLLKKTGLTKAAMSSFGEPELLDDLVDHWNAGNHKEERKMLIERCQEIASAQCIRFSFLSGDVHVCGAGRLYSDPKVNLANDHRYMPQIVSSAIVNAPPPNGVIKTLHVCSTAHKNIDKSTKEKMLRVFKSEAGLGDKLAGRRNWCEIWEASSSISARNQPLPEYQVAAQGSLVFTLRLEMDKNRPGLSMKPFDIPVLPLMTQHGAAGAFSQSPSSVAGISSGLGGMSLNSGQAHQAGQGQYGQPNQAGQGQYGQVGQGQYGQTGQITGGYSPLGDGQHGQLPQAGQGQYGQAGQGQYGQPNQTGLGQNGQPTQTGQGQYGQAGQGQYGQPNQTGQGHFAQPGQDQHGQSGQGQYGPNQANQPGQASGGFDTYPDMSSNSQPFDGNKPYGSGPTGNGTQQYTQTQAGQYNQTQGGQQQPPYQGQQGNSGYAAYPDMGNSNTPGHNHTGSQGYQNGASYAGNSGNSYGNYSQGGSQQGAGGGANGQGSAYPQYSQPTSNGVMHGQSGNYGGQYGNNSSASSPFSQPGTGPYGQAGGGQGTPGDAGGTPNWPTAPQWNGQAPQGPTGVNNAYPSHNNNGSIPTSF